MNDLVKCHWDDIYSWPSKPPTVDCKHSFPLSHLSPKTERLFVKQEPYSCYCSGKAHITHTILINIMTYV